MGSGIAIVHRQRSQVGSVALVGRLLRPQASCQRLRDGRDSRRPHAWARLWAAAAVAAEEVPASAAAEEAVVAAVGFAAEEEAAARFLAPRRRLAKRSLPASSERRRSMRH